MKYTFAYLEPSKECSEISSGKTENTTAYFLRFIDDGKISLDGTKFPAVYFVSSGDKTEISPGEIQSSSDDFV